MDSIEVIYWYHRRLIEVSREMYIDPLPPAKLNELYTNVLNVYNESYKDRPKSFLHNRTIVEKKKLKDASSQAVRYTSSQPVRLVSSAHGECSWWLNHRKLNKVLDFCQLLQPFTRPRYSILLSDVLLNYEFSLALFERYFDAYAYSFTPNFRSECQWVLEQKSSSGEAVLAVLIQFVYMCNMYMLNKHPDSFATQMCSRLLGFYGKSEVITRFVDECDRAGPARCALVAAHQSEPLSGGNIRVVRNFNKSLYQNIGNETEYLLTDRIEVFAWRKGDVCKNLAEIRLPELLSSSKNTKNDNDDDHYDNFHFYDSSRTHASVFVVTSKRTIASVSYSGTVGFVKTLEVCNLIFKNLYLFYFILIYSNKLTNKDETLKKCYLLGNIGVLATYHNRNYFDIVSARTGESLLRRTFAACSHIEFVSVNRHEKLTWQDKHDEQDLFVCVATSDARLRIFRLVCDFRSTESEQKIDLETIYESESFVSRPQSAEFSINCFDPTRKLAHEYLIVTLECNDCILIEFDRTRLIGIEILRPTFDDQNDDVPLKNIGRLIDGFVRMAEAKQALHLYDMILKKWMIIEGDFETIKIRTLNRDLLILNYTKSTFDLYRIIGYCDFDESTSSYQMVKMIDSFHLMDEIIDLALKGELILLVN